MIRFLFKMFWTLVTQPIVILVLAVLLFLMFRFGGSISEQSVESTRYAQKLLPRSQAVDQATGDIADSIVRACPQPEKSYTRLLIVPLRDDRERALENQIREKFQRRIEQGEFTLVEKSTVTHIGEQIREILPGGAESRSMTKEEAIRIGKASDAEIVLFGEIDTFAPAEKTHKIEGRYQFVNVVTGDTLVASRFSNVSGSETAPEYASATTNGIPILKLVILLLFALIWPFALVPMMRRILRRESNRDNLLAILCMTLIPFGIAVVFLGNMTANLFIMIGFLLFFVVAAGWIGFVMNKVAEQ